MVHVIFAISGDWAGMYVDDDLVHQDHMLRPEEIVFALVGKTVESFKQGEVDEDWMMSEGHMPSCIEQIKWKTAPKEPW